MMAGEAVPIALGEDGTITAGRWPRLDDDTFERGMAFLKVAIIHARGADGRLLDRKAPDGLATAVFDLIRSKMDMPFEAPRMLGGPG